MLNPIISLIHNMTAKTWHPALFYEAPLPGPPASDKLVRHKSKSHHTAGFDTRGAAVADARDDLSLRVEEAYGATPSLALSVDLLWDGQGVPAMVVFFGERDGEIVPVIA